MEIVLEIGDDHVLKTCIRWHHYSAGATHTPIIALLFLSGMDQTRSLEVKKEEAFLSLPRNMPNKVPDKNEKKKIWQNSFKKKESWFSKNLSLSFLINQMTNTKKNLSKHPPHQSNRNRIAPFTSLGDKKKCAAYCTKASRYPPLSPKRGERKDTHAISATALP